MNVPPRWINSLTRRLLRERRIVLLCAGSALLHAAVLTALAHKAPRPRQPAAAPPLALSLRPATDGMGAGSADAAAPPASAAAALPAATPPSRTRIAAGAGGGAPARGQAAIAVLTPGPGWDVVAGDDSEAPYRVGFQAVQAPPAARLTYAVVRSVPGQPDQPGGTAYLEWRAGDGGYRLSIDGVTGSVESRGQMSDTGFVPLETRQTSADGAVDTVRFDWGGARATFTASGAALQVAPDGQDRASLLLRLSGMGLGGAAQLNGVIEVQVAGSAGLATVRFERIGEEETIDTALGPLATVHLAQLAPAGAARLDVWLAPARAWYPVRLRVTAPDGSAATQTVSTFDATIDARADAKTDNKIISAP